MERSLKPTLLKSLGKKVVLLSGPRQVGKTVLSKSLKQNFSYFNFDIKKDVRAFKDQEWDSTTDLVIFDELHKMKKWKLWLKGLYDDGRFKKQAVLVTGSARMDTLRKVGDSLAGRQLSYRLNPLDLRELNEKDNKTLHRLMERGGFPEPFLSPDANYHRVWRKNHLDTILRQDLIDLESVRDISSIEFLVELLSQRVGSSISLKALSEDLQVSDKTVGKWLQVLENLFVIFKLTPYSKNIPRGLLKSSKYYFYDTGRVEGESQKLENLVALSIKKELEMLEDAEGAKTKFHFLRTKDQKEIDFYVQVDAQKPILIEVKQSDDQPSKNFDLFGKFFPSANKRQWVMDIGRPFDSQSGVRVESVLAGLKSPLF